MAQVSTAFRALETRIVQAVVLCSGQTGARYIDFDDLDAAQKLGVDPRFTLVPPASQYWQERRTATVPEVRPSTFGVAI